MSLYQDKVLTSLKFALIESAYTLVGVQRDEIKIIDVVYEDGKYYLDLVQGAELQTLYNLCVMNDYPWKAQKDFFSCKYLEEVAFCKKQVERNKIDTKKTIINSTAFIVQIDFDKVVEGIRIYINNDIVDPIDITFRYVYQDKKAYYAKKAEARRKELSKVVALDCRTGNNLVNVYFNKATENVEKTVIKLCTCSSKGVSNQARLIGTYEVKGDVTYKAVTGLSYGRYVISVVQYDKAGDEVFSSDKLEFQLYPPNARHYFNIGGRY